MKDIKHGEIYYFESSDYIKIARLSGSNYAILSIIEVSLNKFVNYHGGAYIAKEIDWTIREATQDEKNWLEECEKIGAYVPRVVEPTINNSYSII